MSTVLAPHDVVAGTFDRPLFEVVPQPGDCDSYCPCNVGPSDGSEYGMHWTAPRTRNVARSST